MGRLFFANSLICANSSSTDGDVSNNYGEKDIWIIKISSTGTLEWEKNYGGSSSEFLGSMDATPDGGYIIGGQTSSTDGDVSASLGGKDGWLLKLNAVGEIEWEKSFGGSGTDNIYEVRSTPDGGYAFMGLTYSTDGDITNHHGGEEVWVVKIAPNCPDIPPIISLSPNACSMDSISADACFTTCPFSTQVYSINDTIGVVEWSVIGAEKVEVVGNQCIVSWGDSGSGSITAVGTTCPFEQTACVNIVESAEAVISTIPAASNNTITVCAGQTIYFDSESQHSETLLWNFGNGELDNSNDTEYAYHTAGTYMARLVARYECLCADTSFVRVEVVEADAPVLDCVGTICSDTEVTYTTDAVCSNYQWEVSTNGVITAGGNAADDFITINWGTGPVGTIGLSVDACSQEYCIFENVTQIPIIGDAEVIKGAANVCRGALETYAITNYSGTDFVWEVSQYGTIVEGQGTHRISVRWDETVAPPAATHEVRVNYDNCYLECGGSATKAVSIVDEFFINGPIDACSGQTVDFSASVFGGGNVLADWVVLDPEGMVFFSSNTINNINFDIGETPGTYVIQATPTNPDDFCIETYTLFLTVYEVPSTIADLTGFSDVCQGQLYSYEAVTPAANTIFEWTIIDGTTTTSKTGRNINVVWQSNGPYELQVHQTSIRGGCSSESAVFTAAPFQAVSIAGGSIGCVESTSVFTASIDANSEQEWTIVPPSAGSIVEGQSTNEVTVYWHQTGAADLILNSCGVSESFPVTIMGVNSPQVNFPTAICETSTTPVSVNGSFDSYRWKNESGVTVATTAIPDLTAGNYLLEVTDANGCMSSSFFSINEINLPKVGISSPDYRVYCPGVSPPPTMHTLVYDPPLAYQWYHENTPIVGATNHSFTPVAGASGSYNVRATNASGCEGFSDEFNVSIQCDNGATPECQSSEVNFSVQITNDCQNYVVTNTSPSFIAGTTEWEINVGDTILSLTGEVANFTINQQAGYQSILMETDVDANLDGRCSAFESIVIPVAPDFVSTTNCDGSQVVFTDLSITLVNESIQSWFWDFGDPVSGAANTSTLRHLIHAYSVPGIYPVTLTVIADNGCVSSIAQDVLAGIIPAIDLNIPTSGCVDNPTGFSIANANEIAAVQWDFGDPASGTSNFATNKNAYHVYQNTGNYPVSLAVTAINGCTTVFTENITISADALSGNITMEPLPPFCEGTMVTLTAPTGGTDYQWSNGQTGNSIVVTASDLYNVTVANGSGCVYVPSSVAVDMISVPSGEINAVEYDKYGQPVLYHYENLTICEGEDVYLSIDRVEGFSYEWSNGGNGATLSFLAERASNLASGIYEFTVTITEESTGCSMMTAPFTVTVTAAPSPIVLVSSPQGFICDNEPIEISIQNYDPNLTYVWNTGVVDAVAIVVDVPGVYVVRGIDDTGCETTSNSIEINAGPDIGRIPSGCHRRCIPDTLCLPDMPGVTTWQWFLNGSPLGGATNDNELIATESGEYFVEMMDVNGCLARSGVMSLDLFTGMGTVVGEVYFDVNENGVIDAADTLMSGQTVFIENDSFFIAAVSNSNGVYEFSDILSTDYTLTFDTLSLPNGWSAVEAVQSVGLYGCDDVESINWLVTNLCLPHSSELTLTACEGTTVDYNDVTLAPNDVATFTLTAQNGCDSLVTVEVLPIFAVDTLIRLNTCFGESVVFEGDTLLPGTQTVFSYLAANGCDSILTVETMMYPEIVFDVSTSPICPNLDEGIIRVENIAGGTNSGLFWTLDGITQTEDEAVGLSAGQYEVVAFDDGGCRHSELVNIEAVLPLEVVVADAFLDCGEGAVMLVPQILGWTEGLTYLWPDSTTAPIYEATASGDYDLVVSNDCETTQVTFKVVAEQDERTDWFYIPNAFSPNANGINDRFAAYPVADIAILDFKMTIYNRWGAVVATDIDINNGWDGYFGGELVDSGVYVYVINGVIETCGTIIRVEKAGDVTVFR